MYRSRLAPLPTPGPVRGRVIFWLAVFTLFVGGVAHAQIAQPLQVKNDFRNEFRKPPSTGYPPAAADNPATQGGNHVTTGQFQSGTAFGGFRTERITDGSGNVLAGATNTAAGATGAYIYPHSTNARLVAVSIGRPIVGSAVSLPLGGVIPPPSFAADGTTVAPPGYYLSVPANTDINNPGANLDFYYSRHAKSVYATQPGRITIQWKEAVARAVAGVNGGNPTQQINTQTYFISTSPARTPQTMYWTEGVFTGPKVATPATVSDVQVVYNRIFTSSATPYLSSTGTTTNSETRTLWWDSLQKVLHAYNIQGRAFVEYLGTFQGDAADPLARRQLGFEIVDVRQDVAPNHVSVYLGNRLEPIADVKDPVTGNLVVNDSLVPLAVTGTEFLYPLADASGGTTSYFAEKQALSTGQGDSVLIYWQNKGLLDVLWPHQYIGYNLDWPSTDPSVVAGFYSVFARPDSSAPGGAAASLATGVPLDSNNVPSLAYQDDPANLQAVLAAGNIFYTNVTPARPTNRALILYSNQTDTWFERVYSELDVHLNARLNGHTITGTFTGGILSTGATNLTDVVVTNPATGLPYIPGVDYTVDPITGIVTTINTGTITGPVTVTYNTLIKKDIGTRIRPDAALGAEPLVGYIWKPSGTAYNPEAYLDPFVNGFDAAAAGAIIGVNALPRAANGTVRDQLEVWWYKKSQPPSGSSLTATAWPQFVEKYQLQWPGSPDTIVLASNAGSGDLPSLQAAGKIYYQNDSTKPGFNPNEEHAVMLSGRAWALRDDLNVTDSSLPYVLVSYTEADGIPAMHVFKVLREDATHTFNRLPLTAGVALQAPLPLPILPLPLKTDGHTQNYEVAPTVYSDPPLPAFDSTRDVGYESYRQFTYTDRKGTVWIYRGPHAGNPANPNTGPTFSMRYFYLTQAGFYFPGLATQPAVGSVTPYLRPYNTAGNPASGFAGNAVTGIVSGDTTPHALDIVYAPLWPAAVPELNVAQTLTLPKAGLPQVRGASSAQFIYQQSIAADMTAKQRSIRLFDPTVAKKFPLTSAFKTLPSSIKTASSQGKTYFPNLPPHLSQRFYFDPLDSQFGSLILLGVYQDDPVGDKYLLLNVLSPDDLTTIKGLCSATDTQANAWNSAIDNLQVTLLTFREDPNQRGSYIDDTHHRVVNVTDIAEITSPETAHDSYAASADGGGTGYVTLVTEDGHAFTPDGNQPSVAVFRVSYPPLYRGQMKVLTPTNPLDDQLTLQHSADFGGHPENYQFQWIYAPGGSGTPPDIQTKSAQTMLGVEVNGSLTQWTIVNDPGSDFAKYRIAQTSQGSVTLTPAGATFAINDGAGTADNGATLPNAILHKEFTAPSIAGGTILDLLLSLDLSAHDGANVYLNGSLVASWNVPGAANSDVVATPPSPSSGNTPFAPLSLVFDVPSTALKAGTNVLNLELYTNSDAGTQSTVNARIEALVGMDAAFPPNPNWLALLTASGTGKARYVSKGPGLLTLSDTFYSMRYRAINPASAAYDSGGAGWSPWVDPQLAEGWIKRALKGINPFNQRIGDLFNNPVDTDVSLVEQAGARWEGDIALSLDNINNVGLIQIYETILHHGQDLSINAGLNYPDANDALVLAGGYLHDLYMVLGDEAYADAANPTIAFSTETAPNFITQYGDVATSLFAFKGEVGSLLDEELGLLRGRDNLLLPGSQISPVYNRLYWNYTRGIDAGEAVYALNYNIKDVAWDYSLRPSNPSNLPNDGVISAADAAKLYPQGHGDAYGHYLTALTGYYSLLENPSFSWTPHTEAVTILGQPVEVGYLHERKFADAAAAVARSASQVLDLTYRQAYTSSDAAGWTKLRDPQEAQGRHWGVDDWACRGGQGAYFNWITANSLLPDVDPNPAHEGITKIDRTTVPEIAELVIDGKAIQRTLDNADEKLNPLGLSHGTLSFDISPSEVDAGKTHFEQIYGRAVTSLQNAVSAFNNAKGSTQFLRQQEDTLETQRNAINAQETAYNNQLLDLYGSPYPDDIGPGKTYDQGYTGPDYYHSEYIEQPELNKLIVQQHDVTFDVYNIENVAPAADNSTAPTFGTRNISVTIGADNLPQKPVAWKSTRVHPGQVQTDAAGVIRARQQLLTAIEDCYHGDQDLINCLTMVQAAYDAHVTDEANRVVATEASVPLQAAVGALKIIIGYNDGAADKAVLASDIVAEAFPKEVGVSNDATSGARAASKSFGLAAYTSFKFVSGVSKIIQGFTEAAIAAVQKNLDSQLRGTAWNVEQAQLLYQLQTLANAQYDKTAAIDVALRALDDAASTLQASVAQGDQIQAQRAVFRQKAAAIIQGYRTRDFAFRAFRDEALESYKTLFDLSARYTFLAARAYDYETGLLSPDNATATAFYDKIVAARALGVVTNGVPQFAGSTNGDPGLSGILAQMNSDWSVAKTRLSFNNPDRYRTDFSLRQELYRILPGTEGDASWKDKLGQSAMTNILDDPDVRKYCLQPGDPSGLAVPGYVITIPTTIATGYNFFGQSARGRRPHLQPDFFCHEDPLLGDRAQRLHRHGCPDDDQRCACERRCDEPIFAEHQFYRSSGLERHAVSLPYPGGRRFHAVTAARRLRHGPHLAGRGPGNPAALQHRQCIGFGRRRLDGVVIPDRSARHYPEAPGFPRRARRHRLPE